VLFGGGLPWLVEHWRSSAVLPLVSRTADSELLRVLRYPRQSCDKAPEEVLQSGVLTSPAEPMLGRAIALTLAARPADRTRLFTELVREIEQFMAAHPEARPWTCAVYSGTEGSAIFRGGVGHSLVIDADGRLWRARSYEDFATTYRFDQNTCVIDTLTPLYSQMREYLPP
jgi:hypothetical protein